MNSGIVIFARMDSSRLPGKAMKPLAGEPMLAWTIERTRQLGDLPIVVATSDRTLDDPVAELAGDLGCDVFRGDAMDVLGRALAAAEKFGFDPMIRISGDSPFIDPDLIAKVVALHEDEAPDLTTNVYPRTFPPGVSVEAVSLKTLRWLDRRAENSTDREHVTKRAYDQSDSLHIVNVTADQTDLSCLHLAVDTPEDFKRAEWIVERLPSKYAKLSEIVEVAHAYDKENAA